MIKIENTDVYGFESAIRGMRNPMNSWDKSDTAFWSYPEEGVAHKIGEKYRWYFTERYNYCRSVYGKWYNWSCV